MADFETLQTRVKRRVIDLPDTIVTEVPDLINEAIRELEDFHNFRVMRTSVDATTVEGTRKLVTTPSDFKSFRGRAYLTSNLGIVKEIVIAPNIQAALKKFGVGSADDRGAPKAVLVGEETEAGVSDIDVYPLPDALSDYANGLYRVTVPYWRYLTVLSANADTNWFTVNAIPWILARATAEAFALNWDLAREAQWLAKAAVARGLVVNLDKRIWLGGFDTLVPHRGAREAKIGVL